MKFDYRLFCNPKSWSTTFAEKNYLWLQTYLLKITAMAPIDFGDKYSSIINLAIFIIQSMVILHVDVLFIYEFYSIFGTGSLEQVTYLITMTIISSFSFFNLLYYQLSHKKYLRIVEYINKNFLHRSAYGVTCVTAEQSYLYAKRFSFYWSVSCCAGTFQWVFVALYAGARTLPLRVNYPFLDSQKTPYYQIIFVMHAICQYITGMSFANNSNVLYSLAVLICGQFDILFCSLKNLRNTAMMFNGEQLETLKYL